MRQLHSPHGHVKSSTITLVTFVKYIQGLWYYDGSAALASERAAISFTRGRLDDDALEIWNDYREKATGGCWKRIRQKVRCRTALQVQRCEASKVVIQCQCSPVVGKHLRAETADGTKSTRHGLQFHKRSKSRGSRLCTIDSWEWAPTKQKE